MRGNQQQRPSTSLQPARGRRGPVCYRQSRPSTRLGIKYFHSGDARALMKSSASALLPKGRMVFSDHFLASVNLTPFRLYRQDTCLDLHVYSTPWDSKSPAAVGDGLEPGGNASFGSCGLGMCVSPLPRRTGDRCLSLPHKLTGGKFNVGSHFTRPTFSLLGACASPKTPRNRNTSQCQYPSLSRQGHQQTSTRSWLLMKAPRWILNLTCTPNLYVGVH